MHENNYFSMSRGEQSQGGQTIELEEQVVFKNKYYAFPNDPEVCHRIKSFKTVLEVGKREISEVLTRRLSMLNRSNFTIKLKQIMKEEGVLFQNKFISRLILYYQAIPFSIEYAKEGPHQVSMSVAKLQKIMRQLVSDLIEANVFSEITIANCGFGQGGEFRVFVPPTFVLYDKKLTNAEKQAIYNSAQLVIKYWQADLPKTIQPVVRKDWKNSRLSSPPVRWGQGEQRSRRQSGETIDVKKTIKLTKNMVEQLQAKYQQQNIRKTAQKEHELKKHRSMQLLIKAEEVPVRRNSNFIEKINQLNKKLMTIRETFVRKKSANEQLTKLRNLQKKKSFKPSAEVQKQEKVEKKEGESQAEESKQSLVQNMIQIPQEDDLESVDTYMQEFAQDSELPSVKPNCEMRKTTLPFHLVGREEGHKNADWHHESAGNMMFKRVLQKNKEIYPELFEGKESVKMPKGESVLAQGKAVPGVEEKKQSRLKKMVSMQTFQNQFETQSINLSEYSNELSNVRRRREKAVRNQQIKQKVQDILLKSKKAIELLKSPGRPSPPISPQSNMLI